MTPKPKPLTMALDDSSPTAPTPVLWDYPPPRCACRIGYYCAACRQHDRGRMGTTRQQARHGRT